MSTLDVKPLILKNVMLTLGAAGDDYRKHVSGVMLTPSSSQTTWKGLGGNSHTDSTVPTWTCQLDYVQDWASVSSLSRYLFEHSGETVAATFQPISGSGPSFTSNLSIVPGAIGGQVDAYATTSVTLGSDQPVLVPAI
jgi:hypothetical protein